MKKIFAFSHSDLDGYPDNFLLELHKKGYHLLALDVKAIELVSSYNLQFTIINDWLGTKKMLEIKNFAQVCEDNWYKPVHETFTSSGICWPEFDHLLMNSFWLDSITSIELVDIFREKKIEEVMIVKQESLTPIVYRKGNGVHKKIWENEMPDILNIIDNKVKQDNIKTTYKSSNTLQYILREWNECLNSLKRSSSLKNMLSLIKNNLIKYLKFLFNHSISVTSSVYTSPKELTRKIAFLASATELSRSKDLIHDLITTFPENVVIISNQMEKHGAYQITKKWKIPVIKAPEKPSDSSDLGDQFFNGYLKLINSPNSDIERKILTNLQFHFSYYCQYRWPILDCQFNDYLRLFSQNPPKILIGASVTRPEWLIPILAANRCKVKTISIPHGFWHERKPDTYPLTTYSSLFDYDLYINPISKKYLQHITGIVNKNLIACKNCTDIDSHQMRQLKPNFSQKSWNVLFLFTPTTFAEPGEKYHPIYPFHKNPKIQMDVLKELANPPGDLKGRISIKFKVHPNISELELFNALGDSVKKHLLPIDSELQSVLGDSDVVIGINFMSSAYIHALNNDKVVIALLNDTLFERRYEKVLSLNLFKNGIKSVYTYKELWNLIRQYFTNPDLAEEMKKDVSVFAKQHLDNSNYPTIGCVLEDLLKDEKEG